MATSESNLRHLTDQRQHSDAMRKWHGTRIANLCLKLYNIRPDPSDNVDDGQQHEVDQLKKGLRIEICAERYSRDRCKGLEKAIAKFFTNITDSEEGKLEVELKPGEGTARDDMEVDKGSENS